MRALNWFGLLALTVVAGCGGASSTDDDGSEPGPGEGGSDEPGAPSSGSGGDSEAGEGSGGTTGGKSSTSGGSTSPGKGGGTSAGAPSAGGAAPVTGGSPSVPPTKPPPSMGGSPSTPPAPPAEGCVQNSQASSATYCQLGLTCDNTDIKSYCADQGGGSWSCECSSGFSYQQYVVRDPLGIAACETVADICISGEVPEYSGPEECAPTFGSRQIEYCELQQQCSRPLEIDDATVSTPTSSRYVSCSNDGTGGISCYCGNTGSQYRLQGVNGLTACDVVSDLCADPALQFDEEPVCTPSGQAVSTNYCSSSTQCTQSEEIADGVIAVRTSYRAAECSAIQTGGSRCFCYDDTGSMEFDSESNVADIGTCNVAAELCADRDSLELSGPIDCSQSSQSADRTYCNSQLDCTQAGTVGGQNVKLHGWLGTNCYPVGDTWSCTCSSGAQMANMTLEPEGTPWDDCTRAAEQCREVIDVEIGTSNGGIGRPIPL